MANWKRSNSELASGRAGFAVSSAASCSDYARRIKYLGCLESGHIDRACDDRMQAVLFYAVWMVFSFPIEFFPWVCSKIYAAARRCWHHVTSLFVTGVICTQKIVLGDQGRVLSRKLA